MESNVYVQLNHSLLKRLKLNLNINVYYAFMSVADNGHMPVCCWPSFEKKQTIETVVFIRMELWQNK